MSQELFDKLLDAVSDSDKAELKLAHNGRVTAMKGYNDRPGKDTKADYDAARALYQETLERLAQKYLPEEASTPADGGEWFRNETEAYNYLLSLGYEVSRGKFNQDKKTGQLTVDGKRVSKFSVLQYGLRLKQARRAQSGINMADLAAQREADEARKIRADADKAEMQAEEMRREMNAKWILREEAEDHEAAIMGVIKDTFRHRVYLDHHILLSAAGGDPARSSEFAHALQAFVDRAFNAFTEFKSLEIEFEGNEDDDADAA